MSGLVKPSEYIMGLPANVPVDAATYICSPVPGYHSDVEYPDTQVPYNSDNEEECDNQQIEHQEPADMGGYHVALASIDDDNDTDSNDSDNDDTDADSDTDSNDSEPSDYYCKYNDSEKARSLRNFTYNDTYITIGITAAVVGFLIGYCVAKNNQ